MVDRSTQNKIITLVVLICIIVIGTVLRIDDIGSRTIGHVETYVPNIDLPDKISVPRPRMTILRTISGTIGEEPHPPGYYVIMFPWTKIFGTSLYALRLPSVIFGVLSIFLIYNLCNSSENKLTGILASGMLALNGLHIFWSQEAKFYAMACFFGLLSTVLLVRMFEEKKYYRLTKWLYVVSTLTGLCTVIYVWFIFAMQLLWVFMKELQAGRSAPKILRIQILTFILGSPLWSFAAYQSRRAGYIDESILSQVSQFFQFGYLFQPEPWLESVNAPLPAVGTVGLVILAIFLLILGIFRKPFQIERKYIVNERPSSFVTILMGALCFFAILGFAKIAHEKDPNRTILIIATAGVPIVLLCIDLVLPRYWKNIIHWSSGFKSQFNYLSNASTLNTILAICPAALIALISLKTPLFIARGMLIFIPYLLIVFSRGLASLFHRKLLWVSLLLILALTHSLGAYHWRNRLHCPRNYKELYEKLEPKIMGDDLIFIQPSWAITAMFYYLTDERFNIVGQDYSGAVAKNQESRIWVLCLPGMPESQKLKDALQEYKSTQRIDALKMWAVLYEKKDY